MLISGRFTRFILVSLAFLGLSISSANAAVVDFNLSFDGTSSSLIGGSVNPDGYSITTGNTYNWSLSAADNDYWKVNTSFNYFAALFLLDGGVRNTDWTATFLLDGATVRSNSILGLDSASVHIGSNVNLTAGDLFDQIIISFLFNSSTATTDIIQGSNTIFSTKHYQDQGSLTYVVSPVPVPAAVWLFGTGILGLIGFSKRRKAV